MKMFEVGGCVRDEIMGRASSDIDFTVVLEPHEIPNPLHLASPFDPFSYMRMRLVEDGFQIFVETPEFLTIRAQFPKGHPMVEKAIENADGNRKAVRAITADFVLARKESDYADGRRPDSVEPGTLEDDLARRDFTMNAIAKADDGTIIDPFGGQRAIAERVIRAVGDPFTRLSEDALRAVRALRFSVTLGFRIDRQLAFAMESFAVINSLLNNISDERKAAELQKMFRFDTLASLRTLEKFPVLTDALFAGSVSLDASMKTKGRGPR